VLDGWALPVRWVSVLPIPVLALADSHRPDERWLGVIWLLLALLWVAAATSTAIAMGRALAIAEREDSARRSPAPAHT